MTTTASGKIQNALKPCSCGSNGNVARPCGCEVDGLAPGQIVSARNRYFTGKFLTARDFAGEQHYHRSRHLLHNRMLHGWGIVCGLNVTPHPNPACQDRFVVVGPGMALDCYGRELVLEQSQVVQIWTPPKEGEEARKAPPSAAPPGPFLLSICFADSLAEPVPALYAEGACEPWETEHNRVHEGVCMDTRPYTQAEIDAGCWKTARGKTGPQDEAKLRALCKACRPGDTSEQCLTPDCACGGMVALALVTPQEHEDTSGSKPSKRYTIGEAAIDLRGRNNVRGAALTQIVGYNWRHGQEVSLADLNKTMERKLKVFFSRHIQDDPDDRSTGITRSTFRVELRRGGNDRFEVVQLFNDAEDAAGDDVGRPYLDDQCVAVFPIPDAYFTGSERFENGDVLHITLRCDFIIDCNGRAVDGDHLRADTPTGDGVEGGLFESWFFVKVDASTPPPPKVKGPHRAG